MAIQSPFLAAIILKVNKLPIKIHRIRDFLFPVLYVRSLESCHYILTTNKNLNSSWIHKRREDTGQTTEHKTGEKNRQIQGVIVYQSRGSQAKNAMGTSAEAGKLEL